MKRTRWGLTLVVDALAILGASSFFVSDASLGAMAWGVVMVAVFGGLIASLVKPQLLGRHTSKAVAVLSLAAPAAMLLGSLELGRISGREAYTIPFGVVVGWLNWSAFRRQRADVVPKARASVSVDTRLGSETKGRVSRLPATARIVFFLYLAVAMVCGVISLMYPPWSGHEFSGIPGALASMVAALPWSILLYVVVWLLHRVYRVGMLFYWLCWALVILNLYLLHRLATNRAKRVGDPNIDSGDRTYPA